MSQIPSNITAGYLEITDRPRLFFRYFPCAKPRACLLLVHGFGEHSGRYGHVIEELQSLNVDIYAFDLRGHGRSEGERGQINSFDDYLADFNAMMQHIKSRHTGKIFVVAHSMGALVSFLAIKKYDFKVAGLVMSCPLFAIKVELPRMQKFLGGYLAKLFPHMPSKAKIVGSSLTHDPQMAKMYDTDDLILREATLRWFFETEKSARLAQTLKFDQPLLLQVAGEDLIVNSDTAKKWFQNLPKHRDQSMKIYPTMLHEIYNESDRDLPINDMLTWIKSKLSPAISAPKDDLHQS